MMISISLHEPVATPDNAVKDASRDPRRLLAVCRTILRRQSLIFDQALLNGSEDVPFNALFVAWATQVKGNILSEMTGGPATT